MSLSQLRTFVEVYRQRSFSEAAAALHITQPAVSNHISSLEKQLQHQLFTRHARGVAPTIVADDLALQVGEALDSAEEALARAKTRNVDLSGPVYINGPIDILASMIAPRSRALIELGVQIRLNPVDGGDVFEQLHAGRADFTVAVETPEIDSIEHTQLGVEQLHLVMNPSVYEDDPSSLEDYLTKVPMIAYDLQRSLINDWLQTNDIALGRAHEVVTAPDLRCIRELVIAGFGWSVLPDYLVGGDLRKQRLRAIAGNGDDVCVSYALYWRVGSMRSPRLVRLRDLIRDQFTATE